MTHDVFMQFAIKEARMAYLKGEMPVGCVLVHQDRVIARAHNLRESLHDPTAHAEILALQKGANFLHSWRLNDTTLYVTLEPCPMCAGAILMARVGLCVYGASDPLRGCCGSVYDLPMDPELQGSTQWISSICEQDCQTLLKRFFSERRATNSPGI